MHDTPKQKYISWQFVNQPLELMPRCNAYAAHKYSGDVGVAKMLEKALTRSLNVPISLLADDSLEHQQRKCGDKSKWTCILFLKYLKSYIFLSGHGETSHATVRMTKEGEKKKIVGIEWHKEPAGFRCALGDAPIRSVTSSLCPTAPVSYLLVRTKDECDKATIATARIRLHTHNLLTRAHFSASIISLCESI